MDKLGNDLRRCVDDCASINKLKDLRKKKELDEDISKKKLCLLLGLETVCSVRGS